MTRRNEETSGSKSRPDVGTICGFLLAVAGILGGLVLEGGRVGDSAQLTAAMIVLGGTAGAVMVTTPFATLCSALRALPSLFMEPASKTAAAIDQILLLAGKARRGGLVSLENDALEIEDPFLRKALLLVVDGADLQEMRRIMELELDVMERHDEAEAKVFEAAGGFAPTIGIIGAVLGLIQVMKHLEDIEAVGHGIAVAFVATVYGVAIANIVLLPAANKLKLRLQRSIEVKEMMLEGVMSIAEGLNPKLVRSKLEAYESHHGKGGNLSYERNARPAHKVRSIAQ